MTHPSRPLAADARAPRALRFLLALAFLLVAGGCVGYQFGSRSLFRSDIRTVYVPIIRNDSFRHDLGVRLTESVQRAIRERTPYVVTGDVNADSVLTCRVTSDIKEVLTETAEDDPRALNAAVYVQASWVDRYGGLLMENRILPPDSVAFLFVDDQRLVPEGGQSFQTEVQVALDRLADRIVSQMEMRW